MAFLCAGIMFRSPFSRIQLISIPIRSLSKSKNSYLARKEALKNLAAQNQQDNGDLPKFSNMIRQLYRKSHPDLLRASHPDFATINDQSMQVLNSVLTAIKTYNEFPPQIVKNMPFYLKNAGSTTLNCVDLNIRTAGGDCKKLITRTFETFFTESGISKDGKFTWDKEYFPTKTVEEAEIYANEVREQTMRRKAYEAAASD